MEKADAAGQIYFRVLADKLFHSHKLGVKTKWDNNSGYIYGILHLLLKTKGIFIQIYWLVFISFLALLIVSSKKNTPYIFSIYVSGLFPFLFLVD